MPDDWGGADSASSTTTAVGVLVKVVVTLGAGLVAVGLLAWLYLRRTKTSSASLEEILASEAKGSSLADPDATSEEGLEAIKAAPWPASLPGMERVMAYEDLKETSASESGEMSTESRTKLRHALMDRCQAHVVWLLRLQREQRSMERLSRRGMISQQDYRKFCAFADQLEAEVATVREEAAWLCDDDTKAAQAADEIWHIAVQIWQQRRQQSQEQLASSKQGQVDQEQLKLKERDDSRRAKARAADAKRSLKGLKGGFLGGTKPAKNHVKRQRAKATPDELSGSEPSREEEETTTTQQEERYQSATWPEELPCAGARSRYEKLKKQTVAEFGGVEAKVPEGPGRRRLRQALMDRCQHHVPFVRFIEAEQARARAALERSKWRSGVGAPSGEDLGRLQTMDSLAKQEMELVQSEAEWLGDPSGMPGMGDRIWQHAFDLEQQLRLRRQEQDKQHRMATDKALKAYASREAKPWPKHLPGSKQRNDYDQLKASALRNLSQAAQQAMLSGRLAHHVVGPDVSKKLFTALVHRAIQCVPIIRRLQNEATAVKIAVDRGHIDDDDLANFNLIDAAVKREVDAVKVEADWLADPNSSSRRMGDNIWAHAFKSHEEKRQAVLANLKERQQQAQQTRPTEAAEEPNAAD